MKTKNIHFLLAFMLLSSASILSGFKIEINDRTALGNSQASMNQLRFTDHRLPSTNLPTTLTPVSPGMATFQTYSIIDNYFSGSTTIDDYIEELRLYFNLSTTNDAITYITDHDSNLGFERYIDFVEFQNTVVSFGSSASIQDAIDNGNPLMAFYQDPVNYSWSIVVVTGYNNDGTYEIFDCTLGDYRYNVPTNKIDVTWEISGML